MDIERKKELIILSAMLNFMGDIDTELFTNDHAEKALRHVEEWEHSSPDDQEVYDLSVDILQELFAKL